MKIAHIQIGKLDRVTGQCVEIEDVPEGTDYITTTALNPERDAQGLLKTIYVGDITSILIGPYSKDDDHLTATIYVRERE